MSLEVGLEEDMLRARPIRETTRNSAESASTRSSFRPGEGKRQSTGREVDHEETPLSSTRAHTRPGLSFRHPSFSPGIPDRDARELG